MKSVKEKEFMCNMTLYEYLKKTDQNRLMFFTEERKWTAKETVAIAESVAERLYGRGVRKGSLAVLRATRCADTIMLFFALHILGAITVLTDAHLGAREYVAASGVDMKPDFYITNEDAGGGISAGGNWVLKDRRFQKMCPVSFDVPEGHTGVWAIEKASHVLSTDPTLIIFTSGSSGKSKAVLLCQKNYVTSSVEAGDYLYTKSHIGMNGILVLPLHHAFGMSQIIGAAVNEYSTMIPEDISYEATLANIEKHHINIILAVPTYLLSMTEVQSTAKHNLSSMTYAMLAGGPSSSLQVKNIENELHLRILHVYGMTEYLGIAGSPYDTAFEYRTAGVGDFYPMTEGLIADDNGFPVPDGCEGEIIVRGNDLMLGYYNDPEETAKVIDKNGYFHTGDLAFRDEMGAIHISGRKKDIIIRGGNNLSAGKIEDAFMSVPSVHMAVAGAKKDMLFGEVPCVAVMPAKGQKLDAASLRAAVGSKLTKLEMPEEIRIMEDFPLTASGKPDRVRIKAMFNQA